MKKKKTLLFVNGHLNVGGVEKALVDLLAWIDYDSYDVDLLLLQGRGDYESRVPKQVRIIEFDTRLLEGPFKVVLFENIKSFHIGIIVYRGIQIIANCLGRRFLILLSLLLPIRSHYHTAVSFRNNHCAEVVAYAVKSKRKFCWWHHGELTLSDIQAHSLQSLWKSFDGIVTVSKGCRELLAKSFGLNPKKISVIPNLIDVDFIHFLAGGQSPYNTSAERKIFVSLSRFSPEKHIENAILAADYLVKNCYRDFIWYIIGEGECSPYVRSLIESKGLHDYVVLTGKIVNPYPFLKFADIFVHPSYVESQGIAILEAMSLSIPVVVTSSIGPESFIINGQNGILVDKGVKALADGICVVLGMDQTQLEYVVEEGKRTVLNSFSPQVVMSLFNNLLNG